MSKIKHNIDYDDTPSNMKTQDYFNRFLGKTSFYRELQNAVKYFHKVVDPLYTLELGSGLGETLVALARQRYGVYVGVDDRNDVVNIANTKASFPCMYVCDDMEMMAKRGYCDGGAVNSFDFIVMLYSFHHISDPLENKVEFLKNMFENMKEDAYLCIAETFLPEDKDIKGLYKRREAETYSSVYWERMYEGVHIDVTSAEEAAEFAASQERKAGELVIARKYEYLVEMSWLIQQAKAIGFEVKVAEYVNNINDGVVLLRKPVKE